MAQHFLLTRQAKSLTLASVFRMTDTMAETMMKRIRWADNAGNCGFRPTRTGIPIEGGQ